MKNQIKKVLSLMLAIVMCMSTLVLGISAEPECEHLDARYVGYQEPTCTEPGGPRYQCKDCGTTYTNETDPALDHDWEYDWDTCTKTCLVCEITEENEYGHSWIEIDSCGGFVCEICGKEEIAGIDNEDNHAHNYVFRQDLTIEPNCNDKDKASGYLFFECTECGQLKKTTFNGQHTLNRVLAKAPTCTEDGWEEHYICYTCNKVFKNYTDTAIAATEWKDYIIPATGHSDDEAVVKDCVETGKCDVCKVEYTKDAHTLVEEDVTATCQSGAGKHSYCTVCDYEVYSNPDEKVAHNFICVGTESSEATCTTPGWDGKYKCEWCDESYGTDKEIPAAHDYVAKKYDATCSADAYTCKECTVCGDQIEITAVEGEEKDGKSHLMIPVVLPATCTENGAKGTMCLYCDYYNEEEWEVLEATGHNYSTTPDLHLDATCSSYAQDYYACTNPGCKSVKSVIGTKYDKSAEGHIKHIKDITNAEDYAAFIASQDFVDFRNNEGAIAVKYGVAFVPSCDLKGIWEFTCTCGDKFELEGDEFYHANVIENAIFISEYKKLDCHTGTTATLGDWCTLCENWTGETVEVTHESLRDLLADTENPFSFVVIDDETYAPVSYDAINFVTVAAVEHICNVRDGIFQDGYAEFDYCAICKAAYAKYVDLNGDGDTDDEGEEVRNLYYDALEAAAYLEDNHEAVLVPGQDRTCYWTGEKAGYADGWLDYCSVCETKTDEGIKLAKKHFYDASILDLVGDAHKTPTCTTPGFSADVCTECGFGHGSTGTYYKELGHNFSEKVEVVAPTCDTKGYTVYKCKDCDETEKRDYVDELGHKNVSGKTFTGSCKDTETDRICIVCGLTVPAACKYEYNVVAPTCTEGGYTIRTCVYCESEEKVFEVDPMGHEYTELLFDDEAWVDATYTKEGVAVIYCEVCDSNFTEAIPVLEGLSLDIVGENALNADANVVNGGLVKFTVTLGANADINSVVAKFMYDKNVLTFVEAKVEGIFDVKDEAGNATILTTATVGDTEGFALGCVTVFADATENAVAGRPMDVTLIGDEIAFVTLTFRVAADADYTSTSVAGFISEAVSVEEGVIVDNYGDIVYAGLDAEFAMQELYNEYYEELDALETARYEYEMLEQAEASGYVVTFADWNKAMTAIEAAEAALADFYAQTEEIYAAYEDIDLSGVDINHIRQVISDLVVEYVEISKLGDVNNLYNYDGRINSADVLALRQIMFTKADGKVEDGEYVVNIENEEGEIIEVEFNYLAEADIDMDGEITLADYALLSQYLVGTITYEDLVLTSQK